MENEPPTDQTDAEWIARQREVLPTSLGTAGLRDQIAAGVRARAVFVATCTSADVLEVVKQTAEAMAAGTMDAPAARLAILDAIRATGYTPEGGFPEDAPGTVPPAEKGTLQDLTSPRRLKLIVETQLALMRGAGEQWRGQTPERLEAAPAWELVRIGKRKVPRAWRSRFLQAFGLKPYFGEEGASDAVGAPTGLIALKGDPGWGELGNSENFPDALDVDYPPFAFESGMGWREVLREECLVLGITGPNGESIDEFHGAASRPITLGGELPMPTPTLSMKDVDPAVIEEVKRRTGATGEPGNPTRLNYDPILERAIARRAAARAERGNR